MKTLYLKTRAIALSGAIFFGLLGVASSQNVRTDQIIALQNYTAPLYSIKFGASTALNTNYTFFLPAAPPTTLNQTLIVTSMNVPSSTYTLGWGSPAGTGWNTSGNTLINSTTEFLGTTDTAQLNLRANNLRVMNYRPASTVGAGPTLIGGYASNTVASTYNGATIGGGGKSGAVNTVSGDYGTVDGGYGNTSGIKSTVAGGVNLKIGDYSFGFSSDAGSTVTDVSGQSKIAYFGNVDMVIGNVDNSARALRFYEANSSSTYASSYYTSFKAGALSANVDYVLPTAQGAASTFLTNDGSGNLSWTTPTLSATNACFATTTVSSFGSTNQNNLNLDVANYTVFRISCSTDGVDITGINAASACDGKLIYLINVGTHKIDLQRENTSSSSDNRIKGTGGCGYNKTVLKGDETIELIYDGVNNRWRIIGITQDDD